MSGDDKKNDLTRIEDLSEFLHQGDDDLDKLLADLDNEEEEASAPQGFDDDEEDSYEDEAQVELTSFDYETPAESDEGGFDNSSEGDFDEDSAEDSEEDFTNNFPQDSQGYDADEDLDEGFENDFEGSYEDNDENDFEGNYEDDPSADWQDEEEDHLVEPLAAPLADDDNSSFSSNDFEAETEAEIELSHELDEQTKDDTPHDSGPDIAEETDDRTYSQPEPTITINDNIKEEIVAAKAQSPSQQDFNEVRDFATNSTFGKVAIGGNPPFSLLLQGIKSEEYDESILAVLNEVGLLAGNEDLYRTSLETGQLLIAQIGEYSAIYLAGKLRRYCHTIKMGLAHEIHQSSNYDHSDQRGLTSASSATQNKSQAFEKTDLVFKKEEIILSSSHFIPGYLVTHSLGPMQINDKIDANEFDDISSINLIDYFEDTMREEAFKKGANAITSIHFTINKQEMNDTNYILILAHGDYVTLREN